MKKFAVIGDPISHSLSPVLHKEIYRQLSVDASFEKFHVMPNALYSFMNSNELDGFNVTIPHKESVIPFLDELDESAQLIGAVNSVHNGIGYNTDWVGFLKAMALNNVDLRKKKCTILGAGGAAKAIAYSLIKSKVNNITIINRTIEKADRLSHWIENNSDVTVNTQTPEYSNSAQYNHLNTLTLQHLIINCTPLGMWPDTESMPMATDTITSESILVDTIYNPLETAWLKVGNEKGAKTIGGLDMFIAQGLASAEIWFGENISEKVDCSLIFDQLINSLKNKK